MFLQQTSQFSRPQPVSLIRAVKPSMNDKWTSVFRVFRPVTEREWRLSLFAQEKNCLYCHQRFRIDYPLTCSISSHVCAVAKARYFQEQSIPRWLAQFDWKRESVIYWNAVWMNSEQDYVIFVNSNYIWWLIKDWSGCFKVIITFWNPVGAWFPVGINCTRFISSSI